MTTNTTSHTQSQWLEEAFSSDTLHADYDNAADAHVPEVDTRTLNDEDTDQPASRVQAKTDNSRQHDTEKGSSSTSEYTTGIPFALVMTSIFLVTFLTLLDTSIISTAIPKITDEFHSLPDVGWYGSAYQLASASLQPLTGNLYTHLSTKWCYLSFFVLFELGSLVCGVAPSSDALIIGRAIAGAGSSGIVNGALTILANAIPLERRAVWTGLLLGLSQLGIVLGPLIGGALTQYSTWRWCFYINLPAGGLAALLILATRIPEPVGKQKVSTLRHLLPKLDLLGFVLFAPVPIQLLLALQYGEQRGFSTSTPIGLFVGAAATLAVWSTWNWRRGDKGLLPFSIAKRRPVWAGSLTQMALAASALLSSYFLPIYFQAVLGRGPLVSGLQLLPQIVPQILFAFAGGILVSKTGYPIPYATVGGSLTAVGSGLLSMLNPTTPLGQWVGFQVLCGVGRGIGSQMPIIAMQANLSPHEIPIAMSLLTFTQSLGTSIFLSVSNTIFDQTLRSKLGASAEMVSALGATGFRGVVSSQDLPKIEYAYSTSVGNVFYLATAVAGASVILAQGIGWVDIRKKKSGK